VKLFLNIFWWVSITSLLISCGRQDKSNSLDKRFGTSNDTIINFSLTESQKRILDGAKKCLSDGFRYDTEMAYRVPEYKNGSYIGGKVFPGGDIAPSLGVCTEVTIRTLRYAGIVDLQEAIYNDLKSSWNDYPEKRWNAKKPDNNIDHRRVPNQFVWFKKNWQVIDDTDWKPADVVIWDMNGDSWGDHIGIVSDKFVDGIPYIIHNFPNPGYVTEENVLNKWNIVGHFRINN
jgi:uncharacterized protein YijF (DUF1287 family)